MISRRNFLEKSGLAALGGLGATVLGSLFPELKPAAANRQGRLQPYDPDRAVESGIDIGLNATTPILNTTLAVNVSTP